jgi:ubiquinone/menaquinone biosynthesis C-methylase UbiE
MLPFEKNVSEVFRILNSDPAGQTVVQFRSLPSANQFRRLYAMVDQQLQAGSHVLDWGCGNGHFAFYLARQGFRVTAYAFDPEPAIFALLQPVERERISYVRGAADDPHTLPFGDSSFDCVFSIGVLEHVRETGGTEAVSMREIRRVLRPGGAFICYHLPNRFSYIEALSRLIHGPQDPASRIYHDWRFDAAQIRSLCEEAGLVITKLQRYGALPRNMFARLPATLRESRRFASTVNFVELALEPVMGPLVQNYAFVARTG